MKINRGGNDEIKKGIKDIKSTYYSIKNPDKLLVFLNDKLKPSEKAKNERGEVFTPLELVNEMLDKLPSEVWVNPKLKWLDPASGIGNFPVMVYLRLMDGLKYFEPNPEKRRKHILENMLYMVELDKLNVYLLKKVFCENAYKLNIFEGSFIKETNNKKVDILFGDKPMKKKENLEFEKKVEKIKEFDIILGNPPYNQGGIKSKKQNDKENYKTIWEFFIKNSCNVLKNNGYLLYIIPLSWLKSTHKCHNLILEKYLIYLELWDDNKSKQKIKAEIPISIFLLQNIDNSIKKLNTIIKINNLRKKISQKYTLYLNKNNSIPLGFISQLLKLQNFINKNNLFVDFKTKKIKANKQKIKLQNFKTIKLSDNYCIDTFKVHDGYYGNKTKEQHEDANKRKLIICNKSTLSGIFIDDGKFGICGNDNYYVLGTNLELIKNILEFKIIEIASLFTKYRQNFLDTDLLKNYIPDLRQIKGIQTEEQLYKAINLTKAEINEIEKFKIK